MISDKAWLSGAVATVLVTLIMYTSSLPRTVPDMLMTVAMTAVTALAVAMMLIPALLWDRHFRAHRRRRFRHRRPLLSLHQKGNQ